MSDLVAAGAAPAHGFALTAGELEALGEAASLGQRHRDDAAVTRLGVSAISALLLNDLASHARKTESHLGKLAGTVSHPHSAPQYRSAAEEAASIVAPLADPAASSPVIATRVSLDPASIAALGSSLAEALDHALRTNVAERFERLENQQAEMREMREAVRECRELYTRLTQSHAKIEASVLVIQQSLQPAAAGKTRTPAGRA